MWSVACVLVVGVCLVRARVRSGLSWLDFLILRGALVYCSFVHRWSANRRNPFPRSGPALILCNHTCSADATFLLAASDRTLSFLVATEHFKIHPIAHAILRHMHCIPVVRTGHDPIALRRALRTLAQGDLVCLFPEGNLSGVALGRCRPAKPGVAFLALVSRLPVYPVHISGGPRTDQLLKSWIIPTSRAVHVIFGKPILLTRYYGRPLSRPLIEEATGYLMEQVARLGPPCPNPAKRLQ